MPRGLARGPRALCMGSASGGRCQSGRFTEWAGSEGLALNSINQRSSFKVTELDDLTDRSILKQG